MKELFEEILHLKQEVEGLLSERFELHTNISNKEEMLKLKVSELYGTMGTASVIFLSDNISYLATKVNHYHKEVKIIEVKSIKL